MQRSTWALVGAALGGMGLLGGAPSCAGELRGDPASYKVAGSTSTGCDALPVFTKRCATSFCHAGAMPSVGLDLASNSDSGPGLAARLVSAASKSQGCEARILVDPSDITKSFLLEKLESSSPECGEQMPLVGEFAPGELACIQSWVAALGAGGDAGPVGASPDASVMVSKDAGARDAGGMP